MVVTADPATEEAAGHVVSHLRAVSERARDSGVEIALECALPLERIQELLQRLGDGVKVCMDMLNPLRFGTGDPCQQLRIFGPARISHFHMKDSLRSLFRPSQRGCVPLGTGGRGICGFCQCHKSGVRIRLDPDGELLLSPAHERRAG